MRALAAALTVVPMITAGLSLSASTASAEDNGVGLKPALGWSSWSFIRHDPTAADIEAQAKAMKSSGLASVGFQYVNVDDFWYECPGSQGPNVDQYGRWVTDPTKFPPSGSMNGIQVVANYVHSLGLKFGLYVTPGISKQAVAENTPIEGTSYTADEIAEPSVGESNYNCGGMVGIDYSKPGAQQFIQSWANEFASWGVDYVKIDGVGTWDVPDIQAWSNALRVTGRPIHLELSNNLNIDSASTWQQYANGWRTGGDIECYCGSTSYPLTDWSNVSSRFNQVAAWAPYGEPGAYNDYDSLEIGNGTNDGLTPDERQTQMSLWSLASSPLILGTDLTNLDPTDLSYLKNRAVLAVDQDGIDATRVVDTSTSQVFAKTEKNGDVIVGLFNTGSGPEAVSVPASAIGLPAAKDYALNNLWTHQTTESGGTIAADVPAHGVALFRVTPSTRMLLAPPATTDTVTGLSNLTAGQPVTAKETFTNDGARPVTQASLGLSAPSGWTVTPTTPTSFPLVPSGASVSASFQVTAPQPNSLFQSDTVTGTAAYRSALTTETDKVAEPVSISTPVQAPYLTYSSASDAPAAYAQEGQQFAINGAGASLWTDADDYNAIYLKSVVGDTSTVETEVTAQQNMNGFSKAGIMVRDDIAGANQGPEGVILYESPSGGFQLEWDSNGDGRIDSVTPANGTIAESLPVWLKLVRDGSTYTGFYSTDGGTSWNTVGSATVPDQGDTQDAGMFTASGASGQPGTVDFDGFSVQ
jgi:hypothetical protein